MDKSTRWKLLCDVWLIPRQHLLRAFCLFYFLLSPGSNHSKSNSFQRKFAKALDTQLKGKWKMGKKKLSKKTHVKTLESSVLYALVVWEDGKHHGSSGEPSSLLYRWISICFMHRQTFKILAPPFIYLFSFSLFWIFSVRGYISKLLPSTFQFTTCKIVPGLLTWY